MSDNNLSKLVAERERLRKMLAKYPPISKDERKKEIMDLLHEYNDIKDAMQKIIGALSMVDNVTFKSLHEKYNLPID